MPLTLIEQNPNFIKKVEGQNKLAIAELFCDTIQGEGVSVGCISTFMRLKGCTLDCIWCDTLEVWRNGNEYSFDEIFEMFEKNHLIEKFKSGQHLILTGGSPIKQQSALINFLHTFDNKYKFLPYIEIENECVLKIDPALKPLVNQWNNSPKLANSGVKVRARYKPDVIVNSSILGNSWFKFVVECEEDWQEIQEMYLDPGFISKSQVILMPCGQTQEELNKTREIAADMSIKHGVRFSDRLHVTIWNKKTGV